MQLVFKNGLVSKEFAFDKEEGKVEEEDEADDSITSVVREGPINFIKLTFGHKNIFEEV